MTVIAIWYEPDDECAWAAADTRISNPSESGLAIRTDTGAKLYALPLDCHRPDADGLFRARHYFTALGFAFAGDVLPALMTYATATTTLRNLITTESSNPPRLASVAEHVRLLGESFSKDVLNSSDGSYGRFEAAIFNWEPHEKRFITFHLFPVQRAENFVMECERVELTKNPLVLGSNKGKDRFNHKLRSLQLSADPHDRGGRLPKVAMEELVRESSGDVGGSMSVGYCAAPFGFKLCGWLSPLQEGKANAEMRFNGIDFSGAQGQVDQYRVAISAIA